MDDNIKKNKDNKKENIEEKSINDQSLKNENSDKKQKQNKNEKIIKENKDDKSITIIDNTYENENKVEKK